MCKIMQYISKYDTFTCTGLKKEYELRHVKDGDKDETFKIFVENPNTSIFKKIINIYHSIKKQISQCYKHNYTVFTRKYR